MTRKNARKKAARTAQKANGGSYTANLKAVEEQARTGAKIVDLFSALKKSMEKR